MTSFTAFVGRGVVVGVVVETGLSLGRGAATWVLHAASRKANVSTTTRFGRIFIIRDTTASALRFPATPPELPPRDGSRRPRWSWRPSRRGGRRRSQARRGSVRARREEGPRAR